LNKVLKETGRGVGGGALSHRAGRLLVVAEVTLSLILLAGAGLLIESITRLGSTPLGFRADHLLTARVSLPEPAYSKFIRRTAFYDKLTSNLGALPGVQGAAVSSSLPLYGTGEDVLTVEGRPAPVSVLGDIGAEEVSADYFRVMDVPLLRGREFDSRDRGESPPVAVVNEALVREYLSDQDPIGKQIRLGRPEDRNPWLTIVGVVGDMKRTTVYVEMGYAVPPRVFRPATQAAGNSMEIVIRVAGDPLYLAPAVQRAVTALDVNVPTYDVRSMNDRVSEFLSHPRFRAVVLGVFAGLALLLAAIGIYGVLSQAVVQRTHEIGIRMALGAEGRDVLRLVVGQGMALALVGVGLGLVAALAVTRFLASMLYGVKPTDPLTFGLVSLVLIGVALLASYIPARRATKVDPMVALRYE
jgi:putative ABC transport system permease protein